MAKVDEITKRFWSKLIVSYVKYYPLHVKNVGELQQTARQMVWDFKDGKNYEEVAQMTAKYLKEHFGEQVKNIVFSCVPASTAEINELRYKLFSERVCALSGAVNGYEHIKVVSNRLAIHEHRRDKEKTISPVLVIDFDECFFKDKKVLVYDDILTTGKSWSAFGHKLEQLGAEVLGGFFLGKTTYKILSVR